jgi:aminoglycoside phosphotransferase family enzyme
MWNSFNMPPRNYERLLNQVIEICRAERVEAATEIPRQHRGVLLDERPKSLVVTECHFPILSARLDFLP